MKRTIGLVVTAVMSFGANAQVTGKQSVPRPHAESIATVTQVRSQYVLHCSGCHGLDGSGSVIGNVPDMRRLGQFLRLARGREFIIQVPGVMGSGLNDQQVAEVTNWVLATLAMGSAPNGYTPFDAQEVQQARRTPLLDVAATRNQLVLQAKALGISLD